MRYLIVQLMLAASATSLLANEVVFSKDLAPILYQNCTGCHRPGEAAPFSLISYEDAAKRGRLIRAVVETRQMPPWKADASTHAFQDERRLTDEQIGIIRKWVEAGVPEGDPADTPALPQFPAGWQLGQPDLIVDMPEGFTVPADGPDIYRNFVIPIGLPEDKWIRAIDLRPSARPVFHHVLYMTDASGNSRRADAADPLPGWSGTIGAFFLLGGGSLGGWAAGAQPHLLRDGLAMPFRRDSDMVLQCHFHPVGVDNDRESCRGPILCRTCSRTSDGRSSIAARLRTILGLGHSARQSRLSQIGRIHSSGCRRRRFDRRARPLHRKTDEDDGHSA